MKRIDPKFHIEKDTAGKGDEFKIVKTSNGQSIPEDEPLILFRARDRHAARMLHYYRDLCCQDACTEFHMLGITNRIEAFEKFAEEHPERMKQAGVTMGR